MDFCFRYFWEYNLVFFFLGEGACFVYLVSKYNLWTIRRRSIFLWKWKAIENWERWKKLEIVWGRLDIKTNRNLFKWFGSLWLIILYSIAYILFFERGEERLSRIKLLRFWLKKQQIFDSHKIDIEPISQLSSVMRSVGLQRFYGMKNR